MVRQLPAGVLVTEAGTGRLLLSNDEAGRISGVRYEPGRPVSENDDRYPMQGFRPDGRRYGTDDWPLTRALRGETARGEEIDLRRGDGSRLTIRVNATPIRDPAGAVAAAVVAFHDMTAEKQALARLRQSEEQLRRSLWAGRLGCFVWDVATNVVTADAAHRAMWGLDPDAALTAADVFERIHPDDVERVRRDEQAALLGGHQEFEFRIVRPGGEVRWLAGHADVVRGAGGEAVQLIGLNRDITDRKLAEEALRRREQEFRALAENTLDLIARFDRDCRHLYVNRRVEEATGLPADAFVGRTNRDLGMPEELCTPGEARVRSVFASGTATTYEFTFPSPAEVTEVDTRANYRSSRVGVGFPRPYRIRSTRAASATARNFASATVADAIGLSANVANPQSGFSSTRSGPNRDTAASARATTSSTASTRSSFWFTTPTPIRLSAGRSASGSSSPARGVASSRTYVPTGSEAKSGTSGVYGPLRATASSRDQLPRHT